LFQPSRTISEVELDPELNIARSAVTVQNAKSPAAACVIKSGKFPRIEGRAQVRIESVEIRGVEKIEHFGAELNAVPLLKLPILGHGEINVLEPWLPHESTPKITELPGSRHRERGWIQVYRLVSAVLIDRYSRNQIRAVAARGVVSQAKIARRSTGRNVKRYTTQQSDNSI
jgi:hypothetical protein